METFYRKFTTVRFKSWFLDEARFKGFERLFRATNPNLPRYVAGQLYQNRLGPNLGKSIKQGLNPINPTLDIGTLEPNDPQAATVAYQPRATFASPRPSPNDLIANTEYLTGVMWTKKPVLVKITPLSFDQHTLHLFTTWRFGFSPKDYAVKNDTARFDIQRNKLINQVEGANEPIILVKDNDKYKLLEGYHRTMLNLLCPHDDSRGAPPDQIELLKQGNLNGIDFTKWLPVIIKAYVGTKTNAL